MLQSKDRLFTFTFKAMAVFTAAVLLSTIMFTGDAQSYPRKVLFEDFTSTTCPPCAASAGEVEAAMVIMENENAVAPETYHLNWPAPGNDPWWVDNNADNFARRQYYGVNDIPAYFIDGTIYNGQRTRAAISSAIRNRAGVDSPLQIQVGGRIIGDVLNVSVNIAAESAVNGVYLYVSLNEDVWFYDAPTGQREHHDSMVKLLPNGRGTRFNLGAGESEELTFEQSMNGLGWHELDVENLLLVAWVQNNNREVLQAANFEMGIMSPLLSISDWEIDDTAEGDGDSRAEQGETVNLVVTIENARNYLPAENVTVTLSTSDPQVSLINDTFEFDQLADGESIANADAPFQFSVDDDFEAHPVSFIAHIEADPGEFTSEETIRFMVEWPPVYVIDASFSAAADTAMINMFGVEDLPWADRLDRGMGQQDVSVEMMQQYDAVIWHTYINEDDLMTPAEEAMLREYLDAGGTLILTGTYLWREIGDTRLFTEYLSASRDEEDVGEARVAGDAMVNHPQFGDAFIFVGGRGMEIPNHSPTVTASGDNAALIMNYTNRFDEAVGAAAVLHEAGIGAYRTLFFTFPLEAISGIYGESRNAFMSRVWEWVNAEWYSAPREGAAPTVYALDVAYPNPFNSRAVVPFSLASAGQVTLGLFDIQGRLIARLVEGAYAAGNHTASLNADVHGLVDGLYYVQMKTSGQTFSRKLLFLK